MIEQVDAIVIGAGVVGLAAARALALSGREVLVLEAEAGIGTQTSSRNSEVIHAGLYYPAGSLKARLCVEGRRQLYAYADQHGFTARAIGKLIVATAPEQIAALEAIRQTALANGVDDLVMLSGDSVRAREPQVTAVAGLFSPSSGLVDSHAFMLALQGELEAHGGSVVLRSPVRDGDGRGAHPVLQIGGVDPMSLKAVTVVNCAGLGAPALAARIAGIKAESIPHPFFAKGNYFSLAGVRTPFRHLVYPVPEPGGLGIHATLDLAGQVRFGPDVEWIDSPDYGINPARADRFYHAIRRYWPALPDNALLPAYCGIRPKISGPGQPAADFMIAGPQVHGIPGLWNLFGIESPGLTAALALGHEVVRRIASGC